MKKIQLEIENLAVDSFETGTESQSGTVAAHDEAITRPSQQTQCLCTNEAGCYPSRYCSMYDPCAITWQDGCMTNEQAYC